ncbi:MAG: cell division protein FtsZ [Candidatus Marsarchaeota archaeon]|jgi:cell division protein FtsZ|nr:cell division protein FtsZ [Candidatus Marsarchaeota archaeon]
MELIEDALGSNDEEGMFRAKIAVCGVGGGGSNTVQRISRLGIKGASLIAINTDSKHINSLDPSIRRVLIGGALTRGLGAGGFAEIGEKAAQYSKSDIDAVLNDYNLVFVTAGMGGGTGTGAAPVAAESAKRNGSIVIGIVTFPFRLERVRLNVALKGIEELRKNVDTLIVIDNQRLVELYPNLALEQAFKVADEVTARAVRGITETVNVPSFINLDFADVKNIMSGGGLAMISVGEGKGSNKVEDVVEDTLRNKLLDVNYEGATSALIHITGGPELTLGDANEIGRRLTEQTAPTANVVWGARVDPTFTDKVEVIAIFTGVKSPSIFSSKEHEEQPGQPFGLTHL